MAYVTPDLVDVGAAVKELSTLVPEYMVPEIVIPMKDLPSLPNGKVNRRGLPEPDFSATAQADYLPPRNSIEEEIQYAWHEVGSLLHHSPNGTSSIKTLRMNSQLYGNVRLATSACAVAE